MGDKINDEKLKIKAFRVFTIIVSISLITIAFIRLYKYDINMLFLFGGIIGFISLTISQMVFKRW